jgi:hypothetical protein
LKNLVPFFVARGIRAGGAGTQRRASGQPALMLSTSDALPISEGLL